ncbi:MAG TPA: hypothetical protein VG223_05860 [Solirubrobacteraceae bacterium]|nr:hypothetical protein [Solirubrobacteraceae bacterium]
MSSASSFRLVCTPSALAGTPAGWAGDMLREGEVALLADAGGIDAVSELAHSLALLSIAVLRSEGTPERQRETVMEYAEGLPLVWVDDDFGETVMAWAQERGPMTLLVPATGPLSDDERRRIDRFVAILARQSE